MGIALGLTNLLIGDADYDDFPSGNALVIDADNQEWPATFFYTSAGPALEGLSLRPGDQRRGWITFELLEGTEAARLQISPQSGFNSTTGVWDLTAGEAIAGMEVPETHVTAVSFSPDGDAVLTAGQDGVPRLWHPATGEQLHSLESGERPVTDEVVIRNPKIDAALVRPIKTSDVFVDPRRRGSWTTQSGSHAWERSSSCASTRTRLSRWSASRTALGMSTVGRRTPKANGMMSSSLTRSCGARRNPRSSARRSASC